MLHEIKCFEVPISDFIIESCLGTYLKSNKEMPAYKVIDVHLGKSGEPFTQRRDLTNGDQ